MEEIVTDYTQYLNSNLQRFTRMISEGRKSDYLIDVKFQDKRWAYRFEEDLKRIGYRVEVKPCMSCKGKFDFIVFF